MQPDPVFREKIEEPEETAAEMEQKILQNDDIQGARKAGENSEDEPKEEVNHLENWETKNGKYGVELFGIKEVVGEFPYKMHFGSIDSYIKEEIKERGWQPSTKHYQDILNELEQETGTEELESFTKMKKLYEYIQIVKKYNEIKKKKEMFK